LKQQAAATEERCFDADGVQCWQAVPQLQQLKRV
jgi:hypothetical protein